MPVRLIAIALAAAVPAESEPEPWSRAIFTWVLEKANRYGVDPFTFGFVYVTTLIAFLYSLAWLLRTIRLKRPVTVPAIATGVSYIAVYLYLVAVGDDLPWWIYAGVGAFMIVGALSIAGKIFAARRKRRLLLEAGFEQPPAAKDLQKAR